MAKQYFLHVDKEDKPVQLWEERSCLYSVSMDNYSKGAGTDKQNS